MKLKSIRDHLLQSFSDLGANDTLTSTQVKNRIDRVFAELDADTASPEEERPSPDNGGENAPTETIHSEPEKTPAKDLSPPVEPLQDEETVSPSP